MEKRSDSLSNWIHQGSSGYWSFTHPTDAQRESILFLAFSFLVILVFWQGKLPYWYKHKTITDTNTGEIRTERRWKTFPFPILLPLKLLTVLYHELSHAIVGMVTIWWTQMIHGIPEGQKAGKIEFIMIDRYEGGLTQFKGHPHVQPNYHLTLPAGYVGSCLFGCWFLFTGFDAKWSKYGALSLFVLTLLATMVCFFVKGKCGFVHHRHQISAWFYRCMLCNKEKAKKAMRKHKVLRDERNMNASYVHNEGETEDGQTEHDLHASQDLIICCCIPVGIILAVLWNWDDSLLLRFAMLFMGLMSALYAAWDIFLDGIKYAKVSKSDATYMAEFHAMRHPPSKVGDARRTTKYYSFIWLTFIGLVIVLVILGAYCYFRKTIVEQAIESREFLPAHFHYGPSDLADDVENAQGTVKGWMGDKD
ncbi:hypothetical protein IAR55_001166 [Kwoniella newhampshirensis]|uniref:Peptidase M50 domain-containing protein n=1 Tax=Kwoniella newhampshirensis TaxID=1651941 RepID=A0AAW0Z503_9TREE